MNKYFAILNRWLCKHPESKKTYGSIYGVDGPPAMTFARNWKCRCGTTGQKIIVADL